MPSDIAARAAGEPAAEPWTRARVISALATARAELLDAIAGLTPRDAERPMGQGKWNARETVLHLVARDRARVREMEAAISGAQPSWRGHEAPEYAQLNAREVGELRSHSWEQALGLLDATRRELQERLATVPEEPSTIWQPEHPFGWMMEALHAHDRHHAAAIRRWRAANKI
ncbi:MAG TPA: DinB family protein [Candidatus Sulfotelmatobacter sp.]|nr:DinB family protein [Candidatus Sulfotelmatobacter sp.]